MPDIAEIEQRLRTAEEELIEHRSDFKNLVENVGIIRKSIENVSKLSDQLEQLNRLEASTFAAHKRIDEIKDKYMRMGFEHEVCMRTTSEETQVLKSIQTDLASLKVSVESMNKTDLTALQTTVDALKKTDSDVKGFWKGQFASLMNKAIPIAIILAGLLFFTHYGPKSAAYTTMEKQQLDIMKELLQGVQSLKETTPRRSDSKGVEIPPTNQYRP